jgi:hypothetical protein
VRDKGNGTTAGEGERLLGGLVEIRGSGIDTAGDSARDYDALRARGHLRQRDSFYKWLRGLLAARPGQKLLDTLWGQAALLGFVPAASPDSPLMDRGRNVR